jgi:hypothetical protein
MSSSLTLSVPRKGVYAQVAYGEFDQSKWGLKGVPKREKIASKESVPSRAKDRTTCYMQPVVSARTPLARLTGFSAAWPSLTLSIPCNKL